MSDSVFLLVPARRTCRFVSVYASDMYSENVGLFMNGKRFGKICEIMRNEI